MENLKEVIEPALLRQKVSVRKMCADIGFTEQGYYRAIKANSMRMSTYGKIKEYLKIDNTQQDTKHNAVSVEYNSEYWKGLLSQLYDKIGTLEVENWDLKKQLGKFNPVLFPVAIN